MKHGDQDFLVPTINHQVSNTGIPFFSFRAPLKSFGFKAEVNSISTSPASETEINFLSQFGIDLATEAKFELKVTGAANQPMLSFSCFPYFKQNSVVVRIESIRVDLIAIPFQHTEKDFVANSVLAQGVWYKIAVTSDGIHKIDKSLLTSLGINTTGLNPNHIHVFGNGEGSLPELNSITYTDDLAQNAVKVIGGQDGNFDDEDYILFYGYGPHQWYANGFAEFEQRRNPYSDRSFYFILIDGNTPAKTITELDYSSGIENEIYTSYDYRDVYETDLVSLVGGGKRWYGDLFDIELNKTFNFSVPSIVTNAQARFRVSLASNSLTGSGTAQRYLVNGVQLFQTTLPVAPYDYNRSVVNFSMSNAPANIGLSIQITRNSATTLTYLDRILLNTRRNLVFSGAQFGFRNLTAPDSTSTVKYELTNCTSNSFVWDLSEHHNPKQIKGAFNSTIFSFWCQKYYREFVASNGVNFLVPNAVGAIENQNLHALPQADYLIVSPLEFVAQAERLANLHRSEGLDVHVVRVDQVYNEFSSGAQDPTAIRKMAKMFYDRALQNGTKMIKYLCLFGDGTYDPKDRVDNNNNYIVTYQVDNSENHISALVTDDYFGMLDDNEAIFIQI